MLRRGLGLEPLHAQVAGDQVTSPEEALGGLLVLGLVLATLSVLHWTLARMKRRGLIAYDEARSGRGLGQAMGALGSILQPHHPPPDERPDRIEIRDTDPTGDGVSPPASPHLVEDGAWPADGLRRGTSRASRPP